MEEMIKQTEVFNTNQTSRIAKNIVGIFFGAIEVALAFRLVFKLLGANPENSFVQGLYSVTQYFAGFFEGIFPRLNTSYVETTTIFEPATLIAMVVIAAIAWAVLRLITPGISNRLERTEYKKNNNWEA